MEKPDWKFHCPRCKNEWRCGCESCKIRNQGKITAIFNGDIETCGYCGLTESIDWWAMEEFRQCKESGTWGWLMEQNENVR